MIRRFYFSVFSILLLLFAGCGESHRDEIDLAYRLTQSDPDSALSILQNLQHNRLSKNEDARYSLVYTIAQDKSGLDVDNDSLLRTAYTYYNSRPDDSLYAKCEYYMGKYYMLNDSLELAMNCLQKSANAAEKQGDKYTLCLVFDKLSNVLSNSNPRRGLYIAKKADRIYSSLPGATMVNKAYCKLRVSELYLSADSLEMAERTCQEAISLARLSNDSACISDAFQDMASILFERKRNRGKALYYSKKSLEYSATADVHKKLNLAWAYIDADSIQKGEETLNTIKAKSPMNFYTTFYLRHIAALKSHNYSRAIKFSDSAYNYIEQMYSNELSNKEKYYNALVNTRYEKGISEGRAEHRMWIIILISISSLLIIGLIIYNYRQYKLRALQKIKSEIKEREMDKKMHEEELKHKEIQYSTMRNFILKKIDIAQRIEAIRGNKDKAVALTEDDWDEIRIFVDGVEGDFVNRLQNQFHNLSIEDLRFLMLVRLRMPAKAMAMVYGISEKSIKQKLFVFKDKVGLKGDKSSLRTFIEAF